MKTYEIDPATVLISLTRQLAVEQPNKVSEARYFDYYNQPECIFGFALIRLGYTTQNIKDAILRQALPRGLSNKIYDLVDVLSIPVTTQQKNWITQVQYWQDQGNPWLACIHRADSLYPL